MCPEIFFQRSLRVGVNPCFNLINRLTLIDWIHSPLPAPNPAEIKAIVFVSSEEHISFMWTDPKTNSGNDPLAEMILVSLD